MLSGKGSRLVPALAVFVALGLLVLTAAACASGSRRQQPSSYRVRLKLLVAGQVDSSGGNTTSGQGGAGGGSGPVLRNVTGRFVLTGALHDAGSFALVSSEPTASMPALVYHLSGGRGKLQIAVSGLGGETTNGQTGANAAVATAGRWTIRRGSGVYAHLHGGGQAQTVQQSITLTGVVRKG